MSKEFYNDMTKPDKKLLKKLVDAQAKQDDMRPLNVEIPRIAISDDEI